MDELLAVYTWVVPHSDGYWSGDGDKWDETSPQASIFPMPKYQSREELEAYVASNRGCMWGGMFRWEQRVTDGEFWIIRHGCTCISHPKKPCRFYRRGYCKKGDLCNFAHGEPRLDRTMKIVRVTEPLRTTRCESDSEEEDDKMSFDSMPKIEEERRVEFLDLPETILTASDFHKKFGENCVLLPTRCRQCGTQYSLEKIECANKDEGEEEE